MMIGQFRPNVVVVDMDKIVHNLKQLTGIIRPGTKIMAVLKDDAYGHGSVEIAKASLANGADCLAVAILEEALLLRENGITAPILILGPVYSNQVDQVVAHDLIQGVSSPEMVRLLAEAAEKQNRAARVHVKIETGMNRLGATPGLKLGLLIAELARNQQWLKVEGVFSHFASSDIPDKSFARQQFDTFMAGVEQLQQAGYTGLLRHIANTAATLLMPETHLDMVRIGISLYGYYPSSDRIPGFVLQPALSWLTQVAFIKKVAKDSAIGYGCTHITSRESIIVTIPVGYGDGYRRALSNCGQVLIRGKKAPVVGRVCMDQMMVDVTDIPGVAVGDEVVLLGTQGTETITASDIGDLTGTIAAEIVLGISSRVPRIAKFNDHEFIEDRLNRRKISLTGMA